MNDQEGYNVKDIIKRNIKNARSDASRLKRPRGPEGKPPQMGSGFMQKRKDAAAKIKAGRRELASQTENFITRTVGMLFDRLNEVKAQGVINSAEKKKGSFTKTGYNPKSGENEDTTYVPGKRSSTTVAKVKGGVMVGREGPKGYRTKKVSDSTENFIGKTVEILAEKLIGNQNKLDVDKSGKLDAQDFKMLRKGKKKGK